jgi:hypothetical protein
MVSVAMKDYFFVNGRISDTTLSLFSAGIKGVFVIRDDVLSRERSLCACEIAALCNILLVGIRAVVNVRFKRAN